MCCRLLSARWRPAVGARTTPCQPARPPSYPPLPPLPPSVALIYGAERLNALAHAHWRVFSGQDYFDDRGVFASALLSAPLLLIMFVVLVRGYWGWGGGTPGAMGGGLGVDTPCVLMTPPPTPPPLQINYLVATVQLLIKMKRRELIYKARQRREEERAAAGGGGGEGKKES